MQTAIMYIECKEHGLSNPGRICRVRFSQSGRTIYCRGLKLKSLKGQGYKANYYNEDTGIYYWVSKPKKDGCDSLYPEKISVEADVRVEYWTEIRNQPENCEQSWYRSPGKHKR